MGLAPKDSPQSLPHDAAADAEGWQCREGINKSEAERLLDWLEANGYSQRELSVGEDGCFTVRWRR
jgi:hypothetical protein